MGKQFLEISSKLQEFIEDQKVFFVGTARTEGRVNISPKGMDTLRVQNPNQVIWLNLTGSGNETAIHLLENNRMTLMFCSFDRVPMILRLYGHAKTYHQGDATYQTYLSQFPEMLGPRQIVELKVDLVQTSCGFGVPEMDFKTERNTLKVWSEKKGPAGIEEYWKQRNSVSIDGFKTTVFD